MRIGRVLTALIGLGLLVAPTANALTLVAPDGQTAQPYQHWADTTRHVPLPALTISVAESACPGDAQRLAAEPLLERETVACAIPAYAAHAPAIYMNIGAEFMPPDVSSRRALFRHEVGHHYDWAVLGGTWVREKLASLFSFMPGFDKTDPVKLSEWIADAYQICSRYRELTWRQLEYPSNRFDGFTPYDYRPTPATHRRVCTLLRMGAWPDAQSRYKSWLRHLRRR